MPWASRLLWPPASMTSVRCRARPSTSAALRPAAPAPTTMQSQVVSTSSRWHATAQAVQLIAGLLPPGYNDRMTDLTRTAIAATLHCLTGCAIGEVAGMAVGTALGWGNAPTVVLAVVLAFAFGYAFTATSLLRAGMTLGAALGVALVADTASIAVMELVDNAVVLAVPGALDAGLDSGLFWASLALALAVAFVAAVPVNRWLIARGRGHAAAHAHHAHGS